MSDHVPDEIAITDRDGDTLVIEFDARFQDAVAEVKVPGWDGMMVTLTLPQMKALGEWLLARAAPVVLLAAVLGTGCAVDFAARRPTDIECGRVGRVDVVVRSGVWGFGCDDAMATVRGAKQGDVVRVRPVIFTDGYAGFGVDDNGIAHTHAGGTYQDAIVVKALASSAVVEHELGHAADLDHGRPNKRDR